MQHLEEFPSISKDKALNNAFNISHLFMTLLQQDLSGSAVRGTDYCLKLFFISAEINTVFLLMNTDEI